MYSFILFNNFYVQVEYGHGRYMFLRLWILLSGHIQTILSGDKALGSALNYFITIIFTAEKAILLYYNAYSLLCIC